jgi:hypothetical protein
LPTWSRRRAGVCVKQRHEKAPNCEKYTDHR